MTRSTRSSLCLVAAVLAAVAGGCNMSKPYPDKALFVIDPGQPPKVLQQVSPATLEVYRVHVASPSDGQTFLYRREGSRYENDYYNGFIAPPEQLLTGAAFGWVGGCGLFASVVDSGSRLSHQYTLEGNVTEMYGDYSDIKSAKAVMAASFFVIDDRSADNRVVFHKTYRTTTPITGIGAEAFSTALNAAYRKILTDLTDDLSRVKFVDPAGSTTTPAQ